jgi:MFS family permease
MPGREGGRRFGAGSRDLARYALTSGELGAVAAQTVMVALLPVLLARTTSSALWVGVAIGGEGAFALLFPFWAGTLSDRIPARLARRFGRRMVVVGGAALVLAGAVAMTPFVSGYWALAAVAFVAFAGLHAYLTPFWALLIDAVPEGRRGRVQGMRGVLRSAGLAYGLVAAGLLFGLWPPLPFLVAAALVLTTTALTWAAERASARWTEQRAFPAHGAWRALARNRPALWLLGADACWNASVDGIRPYCFLYAQRVLGTTVSQTSLGLALLVGSLAAGSWVVGRLGDRRDPARILELSSAALVLAFVAGFLVRDVRAALALAAVAGVSASAIMTLPYPLYSRLVGDAAAGEYTGIYVVSVTVGRIASPVLVGGAIDVSSRWLPRTGGYPVMWLVSAALAAGGWACIRRSRGATAAISLARRAAGRSSPSPARP